MSQRVIEANGGILIERFIKPQQFAGDAAPLRLPIPLKP